ncbi:sn-glycerol-3-phosphate ABC transporter ATP-binding protein UgpC [Rhizobium sp. KVB221]|uniref:Sn-glycerol-3-phosphate ABC transporter ATP-binding protein UgpC n=1 Tax=Rhizobium setariae TaxID=2801340 RepID=A0A936YJX2_9HYPH|nr:sn-glycerol-3-phosphate ABC transporter ATP-binding protein UgpC [Rhizobium setariae]MBL0371563.1 sn-glycerol-3-phosphate ABC transporter ATP-binding protein UgpC [Rhizobium setariae]
MSAVTLKDIVKVYGRHVAVRGIDLEIPDKAFVVFVGPSGCGKSTTLRMVAGLETISHGELLINGKVVNDVPSRDRGVAMVFQTYALYPHMTVRDNLAFSLKLAKIPKDEADRRIERAVSVLELGPYLDRKPSQLSGGQRQRVAMGRAIVREPDVFLFDEPLSNLDAKLRNQMRIEIKRLQRRLQVTTIYVTHDQIEAMTLADLIVVMKDGYIAQAGSPIEVFERPANRFVAGFIGSPQMNFFEGRLSCKGDQWSFMSKELHIPIQAERYGNNISDGQAVWLGLRAEDIVPVGFGVVPRNLIGAKGTISLTEMLGNETLLFGAIGGAEFVSRMQQPRLVDQDEEMDFHINVDRLHLFDFENEENLLEI